MKASIRSQAAPHVFVSSKTSINPVWIILLSFSHKHSSTEDTYAMVVALLLPKYHIRSDWMKFFASIELRVVSLNCSNTYLILI
ncbi:MAG: hypothetical protein L0H55_06405 [Candidatus Nitrosocosmicus sp.]|nr:hypothetical protein [Candidatus Nitrosocosmicus sp.]